ncbi:MAG: DUF3126 family protein [Pseudomonadota bacterium]
MDETPSYSLLGVVDDLNVKLGDSRVDKTEIARVEAYLKTTFGRPNIELRAQPKKADMAEVFINDEFIATLYRDVEDGETSYQFQMAILEMDLPDA